ncbi:hypothetical protein MN608_08352 [Microdochium nivale]|nr:hypothetical protein MN608_08352 [Microdochium nivale]
MKWNDKFNTSTLSYTDVSDISATYNVYGARTIPTIVIWGHGNERWAGTRLEEDHVTVACVKADQFQEGAAKPTGDASSVVAGARAWMAGLIAATAIIAVQVVL